MIEFDCAFATDTPGGPKISMLFSTDSIHVSIFAVVVGRKGGQDDYVMQSPKFHRSVGFGEGKLKCDQEPSTLDVANALIKRCQSTALIVAPKGLEREFGTWRTSEFDNSGTTSSIANSGWVLVARAQTVRHQQFRQLVRDHVARHQGHASHSREPGTAKEGHGSGIRLQGEPQGQGQGEGQRCTRFFGRALCRPRGGGVAGGGQGGTIKHYIKCLADADLDVGGAREQADVVVRGVRFGKQSVPPREASLASHSGYQ